MVGDAVVKSQSGGVCRRAYGRCWLPGVTKLFLFPQGTTSSKRKKSAKLKRVMQAVKKHERRAAGSVSESFAAMQLLHDPQVRLVAELTRD